MKDETTRDEILRVDVDFSSGTGDRWTNPNFVEINPDKAYFEMHWECNGKKIETFIPLCNVDKIEIERR